MKIWFFHTLFLHLRAHVISWQCRHCLQPVSTITIPTWNTPKFLWTIEFQIISDHQLPQEKLAPSSKPTLSIETKLPPSPSNFPPVPEQSCRKDIIITSINSGNDFIKISVLSTWKLLRNFISSLCNYAGPASGIDSRQVSPFCRARCKLATDRGDSVNCFPGHDGKSSK